MKKKKKTILSFFLVLTFLFCFSSSFAVDEILLSSEEEDTLLSFEEEYEVLESEEDEFIDTFETEITKNDVNYSCISLTKEKSSDNEKKVTKTQEKTSLSTNNEDSIKEIFGETYSYSEGGFEGTLSISDIDIKTNTGTSYEAIDELDISFEGYSSDDLSAIDKTTTKNGTTYYLINVDWEADETKTIDGETVIVTYKGTMHYQTVVTKTNATTYDVTVTYSGTATKTDTLFVYTALFQEVEVETYEYNIYYYYDGVLNQEETISGTAEEGTVIEADVIEGDYVLEEDIETTLKISADDDNNLSIYYVTKTNYIVPTVIVSVIGLILVVILVIIFSKNTKVYNEEENGNYKLIKKTRLTQNNTTIDLSSISFKINSNLFKIKVNAKTFEKLKNKEILIIKNTSKHAITLNSSEINFKI